MIKIPVLSALEKEALEQGFRNHAKPYFRNRAQCILLRAEQWSVKELAKIFKTKTHTIYDWLHRYEQFGFEGLIIQPGRGLKSAMNNLTEPQIEQITAEIKRNPQSLREVSAVLSETFGFKITKWMLKTYLKKTKIQLA